MKDIFKLMLGEKKKKRTLTTAQKRNLIEDRDNRCALCKEKFSSRVLRVHHLKPVAKSESGKLVFDLDYVLWGKGKGRKPTYDRRSNLVVLCPTCHAKLHAGLASLRKSKKRTRKKTKRRRKKQKQRPIFDVRIPEVKIPKLKW